MTGAAQPRHPVGAGFGLRDVLAVTLVRDDADLAFAKLGVGLDALDERGAARRGCELLFERDDLGTIASDRVERFQRVGIGEGQRIAKVALLLKRWQILRSGDDHGIGHAARSLTRIALCVEN